MFKHFSSKRHCKVKEETSHQPGRKYLQDPVLEKGLYPGTYKGSSVLTKESNDHSLKWTRDFKRYFSKEDLQMANEHVNRGTTSFVAGKCNLAPREPSPLTCWRG